MVTKSLQIFICRRCKERKSINDYKDQDLCKKCYELTSTNTTRSHPYYWEFK